MKHIIIKQLIIFLIVVGFSAGVKLFKANHSIIPAIIGAGAYCLLRTAYKLYNINKP